MTPTRPKLVAAVAALVVTAASLFAFAQPAAADTMLCESYSSMIGYCDLYPTAGAHNERWTVYGSPYSPGDDSATITGVRCDPGFWVPISVSYLNDYGAGVNVSKQVMCSNGAPM
ncbi:MAG TPA: hypothetical protein VFU36_06430 [Jatrophihabitans sp.]|nr:hypothetical protein [Jatrophihabitans sp.]